MKRWSKLKKRVEGIFCQNLGLEIHANVYSITTKFDTFLSPRQWITLDKRVIFDFPGQFLEGKNIDVHSKITYIDEEGSTLSKIFDEYVLTPKDELLNTSFAKDRWGFTDILKGADRRLGKARLLEKYKDVASDGAVGMILKKRFGKERSKGGGHDL